MFLLATASAPYFPFPANNLSGQSLNKYSPIPRYYAISPRRDSFAFRSRLPKLARATSALSLGRSSRLRRCLPMRAADNRWPQSIVRCLNFARRYNGSI